MVLDSAGPITTGEGPEVEIVIVPHRDLDGISLVAWTDQEGARLMWAYVGDLSTHDDLDLGVVVERIPFEGDWRSRVKEFGSLPDGKWWEQDSQGQKITFELVEDHPPSRRVVHIADKGLPFGGTWTFEIAPEGEGSVVRITEDGEIYNVVFRFVARYFMGYTSNIDGYLRDLGRKFGESAQIEA